MSRNSVRHLIALAAVLLAATPAVSGELAGPFPAEVERVIDGDTVRVRARVWLGQELTVNVRLRGVDAPELHRPGCEAERAGAESARDFVVGLLGEGPVVLTDISGGKFFGRVIADMANDAGTDLALALLESGHGRPYDGGRRQGWCDEASAAE